MKKQCKRSWSRGSLTVEASIILPLFVSVFYILLLLIKFTCTGIVLDHAVNEAAKEIASAAYPISFINELEDEAISEYGDASIPSLSEELRKLEEQTGSVGTDSIWGVLVSEQLRGEDISDVLKDILEDYSRGLIGELVDRLTPAYWDMKSSIKYFIANAIIMEHLENPLIDKEHVRLRLVELPQGRNEYAARSASPLYESYGLIPGRDFRSDDVVLQLEYGYKVKVPFMEPLNIKMVYTAVERAWLEGGFGIVTAEDEGLDLELEGQIVFITRTGIRFHKSSCWHLRRSCIPVELGEAQERGYTPCRVCKPLD